jgi:hypothetical protein
VAKLGEVILRGAVGDRPAAGTEGRLYISTDEDVLYRDNGSSWDAVVTNGGAPDASGVTYTPDDTGDWAGGADPGAVGDALDQLAARAAALEGYAGRGVAFYVQGELSVEARAVALIAPCALIVLAVRCVVAVAPTGADLILDVNKNGTTLFTTQANRPTIAATETSDTSVAPDVTAIALGDVISLDIDQVGSTLPGEDLSVTIVCEVA